MIAIAVVIALGIAGCGSGDAPEPETNDLGQTVEQFDRRAPNIVVVMTDDQAVDTMRAMPKTTRLLGGNGTTFTNEIVSFPLCCPSRAAFLTGQYAHNNGVRDNGPPDGGIGALEQAETLPVWLREAGYDTAFVGKYLNGYGKNANGGPEFIPPGWVNWFGLNAADKTSAYDYDVNENGELVHYGDADADYKTDVLAHLAEGYVRDAAKESRPFFLWVATSDPHTDNGLGPNARRNPLPAPRDDGTFKGVAVPQPKSYDEADVSDKPEWVQETDRLTPEQRGEMRTLFTSQLESLGAVDDLVAGLYGELNRSGELKNTIFVFTSDNGFIRGQHRIDSGKSLIYEESVKVPLLVAGPGFDRGETFDPPVANVDLGPTLLRAAGVEPGLTQDGVPLQPVVAGDDERPPILLEIYARKDGDVFGLRTADYAYAEHETGFVELYDLRKDPLELENVAGEPAFADAEKQLAGELERLRDCSGASCR